VKVSTEDAAETLIDVENLILRMVENSKQSANAVK